MMDNMGQWLPYFWAYLIAFSILVYIIVDGYDFGVAMLFPFAKTDEEREQIIGSIAPFWDGNETWLIIVGACLFGAFPAIYAIFLSAFYIPVVLLLAGLIFRGVSFEFREQALKERGLWEWGFVGGSAVATIVQGAAIGTLILGLPIEGTTYIGNGWDWLSPFPVMCGIGLCVGYMMLGAGWLIIKTDGRIQQLARKQIKYLSIAFSIFVGASFFMTMGIDNQTFKVWSDGEVWHWIYPLIGFSGLILAIVSSKSEEAPEWMPFFSVSIVIFSAFSSLAVSFWPYMMPYSLTIEESAAPTASLEFMFWGAIFMFPLVIFYFLKVYHFFKDKEDPVKYEIR